AERTGRVGAEERHHHQRVEQLPAEPDPPPDRGKPEQAARYTHCHGGSYRRRSRSGDEIAPAPPPAVARPSVLRSAFESASVLCGVILSGSTRTIRYVM